MTTLVVRRSRRIAKLLHCNIQRYNREAPEPTARQSGRQARPNIDSRGVRVFGNSVEAPVPTTGWPEELATPFFPTTGAFIPKLAFTDRNALVEQ